MSDQSAAEAEAGRKWKWSRQESVLKGIFRHGKDGRWCEVREAEAGGQQSFNPGWHSSVTFTEKNV